MTDLRTMALFGSMAIGALLAGVVCGMFPLAVALKRGHPKPGLIAVGVCVLAQLIGGADLAWLAACGGIAAILAATRRPPAEHVRQDLADRIRALTGR